MCNIVKKGFDMMCSYLVDVASFRNFIKYLKISLLHDVHVKLCSGNVEYFVIN